MVEGAEEEDEDADEYEGQPESRRSPGREDAGPDRAAADAIPWKKLKIVNPKPMSESEVRMVAMSVRSAAMRVRCTARLVRIEAIFSLVPRSSYFIPTDSNALRAIVACP